MTTGTSMARSHAAGRARAGRTLPEPPLGIMSLTSRDPHSPSPASGFHRSSGRSQFGARLLCWAVLCWYLGCGVPRPKPFNLDRSEQCGSLKLHRPLAAGRTCTARRRSRNSTAARSTRKHLSLAHTSAHRTRGSKKRTPQAATWTIHTPTSFPGLRPTSSLEHRCLR